MVRAEDGKLFDGDYTEGRVLAKAFHVTLLNVSVWDAA